MNRYSKILAACALVFSLLPVQNLAQESTTDPSPAGSETPIVDLVLGEEVSEAGESYLREKFGDWEMRCVRTADGKDPCQLYQLMMDGNGNSVAEISLFELPKGQAAAAGATIAVPLQTLLTEQLLLSIDGRNPKRYPFSYCALQGCYARIGLTDEDITSFKRGVAATVVIVPVAAPDQKLGLRLSLSGFTSGFEAIQASNKINAEE